MADRAGPPLFSLNLIGLRITEILIEIDEIEIR